MPSCHYDTSVTNVFGMEMVGGYNKNNNNIKTIKKNFPQKKYS